MYRQISSIILYEFQQERLSLRICTVGHTFGLLSVFIRVDENKNIYQPLLAFYHLQDAAVPDVFFGDGFLLLKRKITYWLLFSNCLWHVADKNQPGYGVTKEETLPVRRTWCRSGGMRLKAATGRRLELLLRATHSQTNFRFRK